MTILFLATRNGHKIGEIRGILGKNFEYLSLLDFPSAPEVVEDAGTFAGNATKKAVALAKWLEAGSNTEHSSSVARPPYQHCGGWTALRRVDGTLSPSPLFVLADDSGLEVDALNGAPGVHSARFAALDSANLGNSSDAENKAKLLRLLRDVPLNKRSARFRCLLALTPVPDPEKRSTSPVCYADETELQTELFEGTCEGRIGFASQGAGGFGYDPLFIPEGRDHTFAELGEEVKNSLSHRSRALAKLRERLALSVD